jgi:hypothetical protein
MADSTTELQRENVNNYVFLPATPLDDMLLSNFTCGDADTISDNTQQPETYAYCHNPYTGQYEIYATYRAKPEPSEYPLMAPTDKAHYLEELARWNCPFPVQIRGYCASPASNMNGWSGLLHLRRSKLNTGQIANPTAQGPDKDPGTSMLTRNVQYAGPWLWGQWKQPGVYALPDTETAVAVIYADSPSCGVCDGRLSDGCQVIFILGDITASGLASLYYSTNGGTSFSAIVLAGAIAAETDPRDIIEFNGRLVMTIDDTIYYNSTPTSGATWVEATITASVALTTTGKLAKSGGYVYAIFNTAGVLRSADGVVWEEVTAGISGEAQTDISAAGDVVVTAGANDSIQISTSQGAKNTWESLATGPGAATDDAADVSVALRDATLPKSAVIFLAQVTGAITTIYKSNDLGVTWSTEKTIATVEAAMQLEAVVDGDWIWANYDAVTIKNHNRGNDLEWGDVSNPTVGSNGTVFAVCPHNPNIAFVATNLSA